jgi:glutaredoxin 3
MASRKVEIFSAGCFVCGETVELVKRISCPSCDVTVLNMNDQRVAQRARSLGIRSVPAVVVDGKMASCCAGRGPNEAELRAAGIGQQL